jgi:hypothetical protein
MSRFHQQRMIKNRKHRNANGKNVLFTHKKSANILPAPGGVIGSSGNKKNCPQNIEDESRLEKRTE